MSGPNGAVKPSDTATFSEICNPAQGSGVDQGRYQTGGWDTNNPKYSLEVLEGLPAASFVTVSGDSRLKQVGTKQQYALTISLSGDASGYVLTPGLTDAQGDVVTPVGNYFTYYSEQKFVCTVANGKITPTGRGSCTVEVRWPVGQVNANWSGATSNPSNFIYASIMLTVVA
jgi:hypothetical protein